MRRAQGDKIFRSIIVVIFVVVMRCNNTVFTANDALSFVIAPTNRSVLRILFVVGMIFPASEEGVCTLPRTRCFFITMIDRSFKFDLAHRTISQHVRVLAFASKVRDVYSKTFNLITNVLSVNCIERKTEVRDNL